MAHMITEKDTMLSGNNVEPWHYYDTKDRCTVVEGLTSAPQILTAAGMDWVADKVPLFISDGNGGYKQVDSYMATVRHEDQEFIDVCSPDYPLIQMQSMVDYAQAILDDTNVKAETAGTMDALAVAWVLWRLGEDVKVAGMENERLTPYLMTTLSFAPKRRPLAFQAITTYERVVCNNTWTWAMGNANSRHLISIHAGDVAANIAQAREDLKISYKSQKSILEVAEQLVQKQYNEEQLDTYVRKLFPAKQTGHVERDEDRAAYAANRRVEYLNYLISTPDLKPINDTFYGLVQAATGYDQHVRRFGNGQRKLQHVFGMGTQEPLGQRATALAVKATGLSGKAMADIVSAIDTADLD